MKLIDFKSFPDFEPRLPLQAAPLDGWAFELEKAVLGTVAVDQAEVVLYVPQHRDHPCDAGSVHVVENAGGLRLFENDGLVSFKLAAGQLLPGKQFSILINNEEYFGTYVVGSAGQEIELSRIADWLELKSEVRTRVERTGSLLTVYLTPAFKGQFNSKSISVGLGAPSVENSNNPSMFTTSVGQPIEEVEMDGYEWTFTNLMPGQKIYINVFIFYEVVPGDTSESIIKKFAEQIGFSLQRDLFWIPKGQKWNLTSEPGQRQVINTNQVQFTANYIKSSGNTNYYNFSVIGDIKEGNVFRYSRIDGSIFEVMVRKNWTVTNLMAALMAEGDVASKRGQTPNPKFLPGTHPEINPSAAVIIQTLKRSKRAQTYQVWNATVGDDVLLGNRFELRDARYTAKAEDTASKVAAELAIQLTGKADGPHLIFFTSEDQPFWSRSVKGSPLNDADQAPVSIAGSGVLVETKKRTLQGWVQFPCEKGMMHVGLRKKGEALPFALSNLIHVKSRYAGKTVLLQAGSWQLRLAGTLRSLGVSRDDETSTTTSGAKRTNSKPSYNYDLHLAPQGDWFHRALTTLLSSSFFVEGNSYQVNGDYSQSDEQPSGFGRSARQTLLLNELTSSCFSSERAYVEIQPNPYLLKVRLAGEDKNLQMTTSAPVSRGAYYLEIYSGGAFACQVIVKLEGLEILRTYLSGFGHTKAQMIALQSGNRVEVSYLPMPQVKCQYVDLVSVTSWACELRTTTQLSDYSEEYGEEYADKGKNIQIPAPSFGGTDEALTGWKVPTMLSVNGNEVSYAVYLSQYVSQGYPFYGPVYDPDFCSGE